MSEYTFRTSTRTETATPHLDWVNRGGFVAEAREKLKVETDETRGEEDRP
jgi:hypothetical protein